MDHYRINPILRDALALVAIAANIGLLILIIT